MLNENFDIDIFIITNERKIKVDNILKFMNKEAEVHHQPTFKRDLSKAWCDLINSFVYWRIFCIIGINDIRKRYARSKIGQFWLTLSLAINIGTLGVVWSYLFKMPIVEYLPFLAGGTIFWTYISSCIIEGSNLYITSSSYLRELNISKLTYVNSLFVRNIVVLGHNLLVLIPIYLFFSIPVSITYILFSMLGLLVTSIFLFPVIMFISLVSLRFRDLPNIITSLMQIIFYVTPVMWKINLMPEKFHKYFIFNPFAVFLSICRDSLFATTISNEYWLAATLYIALAWLVAFIFFSRFRARIVYWL
jgi:lipopolysaccharide transport system permease protein